MASSPAAESERRRREALSLRHALYLPALELEHSKAEEVVTELFEFWIAEPDELPESYFAEVETEGLARVVADYIAGMTDNFILLAIC
jgi:dGTPase